MLTDSTEKHLEIPRDVRMDGHKPLVRPFSRHRDAQDNDMVGRFPDAKELAKKRG